MTNFSYLSKLGCKVNFPGEWLEGFNANIFLTKCGKVFQVDGAMVYLTGSYNEFEQAGRRGEWVRSDRPSYFGHGVYMGTIEVLH